MSNEQRLLLMQMYGWSDSMRSAKELVSQLPGGAEGPPRARLRGLPTGTDLTILQVGALCVDHAKEGASCLPCTNPQRLTYLMLNTTC